jgi:dTDP-4-amino-4,6-dideoxygalactose transaminase
VFTDDGDLASVLRSLRVHGQGSDKYDNVRIGINGRIDTLQAAILLAKLSVFEGELEQRRAVAMRYNRDLAEVAIVPTEPDGYRSNWGYYSVQVDNRDATLAALKSARVPSAVYYPRPLHRQTAYAFLKYTLGCMPVSETTSERIMSLPMHPYLTADEQSLVIAAMRAHAIRPEKVLFS